MKNTNQQFSQNPNMLYYQQTNGDKLVNYHPQAITSSIEGLKSNEGNISQNVQSIGQTKFRNQNHMYFSNVDFSTSKSSLGNTQIKKQIDHQFTQKINENNVPIKQYFDQHNKQFRGGYKKSNEQCIQRNKRQQQNNLACSMIGFSYPHQTKSLLQPSRQNNNRVFGTKKTQIANSMIISSNNENYSLYVDQSKKFKTQDYSPKVLNFKNKKDQNQENKSQINKKEFLNIGKKVKNQNQNASFNQNNIYTIKANDRLQNRSQLPGSINKNPNLVKQDVKTTSIQENVPAFLKKSNIEDSNNQYKNNLNSPNNKPLTNLNDNNNNFSNSLYNSNTINTPKSIFKKKNFYNEVYQASTIDNKQGLIRTQSITSMTHQSQKFKKSDFIIGKKMGKGQFGQVFLVTHKQTGFICAMKTMSKKQIRQQKYQNQIARQLSIQFYLSHRNVTPLYGYFDDQQNVYLLVQFCTNGHLLDILKKIRRMEEQDVSPAIKQLCEGIDYIHKEKIIHRDIKPQNILFSHGVAKITDFGWAVYRGYGLRKTASGSPLYYSPQIVQGKQYDEKIDIWDIGMMTYQCLIGKIPFKVYTEMDLTRIVSDEVTFPDYVDVTDDAKDFILKILQKKPQNRMTLRQMLRHPFITKYNEKKLEPEVMNQIHKIMN